jgi:hypothetical protein
MLNAQGLAFRVSLRGLGPADGSKLHRDCSGFPCAVRHCRHRWKTPCPLVRPIVARLTTPRNRPARYDRRLSLFSSKY